MTYQKNESFKLFREVFTSFEDVIFVKMHQGYKIKAHHFKIVVYSYPVNDNKGFLLYCAEQRSVKLLK